MRKALEVLGAPCRSSFVMELYGCALKCIRDQSGNYVVAIFVVFVKESINGVNVWYTSSMCKWLNISLLFCMSITTGITGTTSKTMLDMEITAMVQREGMVGCSEPCNNEYSLVQPKIGVKWKRWKCPVGRRRVPCTIIHEHTHLLVMLFPSSMPKKRYSCIRKWLDRSVFLAADNNLYELKRA